MTEYWKVLPFWNKVKFIISLLIGILGVIFATLNWNNQAVHLVFFKANLPITILVIIAIVIGYAYGHLFNFQKFRRKEKELDQLRETIATLEKELLQAKDASTKV
jgi:uncharacterized integral membrane protein